MYSVQSAVFLLTAVTAVKANFEDTRCRCTCPSTKYFAKPNSTIDDNYRRYYTKTNVNSGKWHANPQNVVKQTVVGIVDDTHVDAFLANCDCKFESRNTVLLKVVVIFVICVLFVLGTYMGFLIILDPMLRRQRQSIPYRRQDDEASEDLQIEENIFAPASSASSTSVSRNGDDLALGVGSSMQMRPRSHLNGNVLEKVEAKQNEWQSNVEEQRRKVMSEHSILN